MRGVLLVAWLHARYPWTMLAIWTFRGLRLVDGDAAESWWGISGMQAKEDRARQRFEKLSA